GDEAPLTKNMGDHHTALTTKWKLLVLQFMKSKVGYLQKTTKTHHILRESQGRDLLNILMNVYNGGPSGKSILIVIVGICQVFILEKLLCREKIKHIKMRETILKTKILFNSPLTDIMLLMKCFDNCRDWPTRRLL
ncbi:hypothetical protein QZH41_018497, partial [Actinostola sp. cb2023]